MSDVQHAKLHPTQMRGPWGRAAVGCIVAAAGGVIRYA